MIFLAAAATTLGPVLAQTPCVERALPLPTPITPSTPALPAEAYASGVSWAAVFAGATVSASLGLVLLALGVGFGLSAVSPWSDTTASLRTLGLAAIVWMLVMEIVASAFGGYLAGRLRTKWARIHSDEVYFRDTAHGFLAWALASVVSAAFLASAASALLGTPPTDRTATHQATADSSNYYVDKLFRPAGTAARADSVTDATRAEAARILMVALRQDAVADADRNYLVSLVASRTGLAENAAARQVDSVLNEARGDLDAARKVAARASLWMFLALLAGAFCSSYAATIGGRQRDKVVTVG